MEDLHALDAETTQAFLNRIHPYNSEELPEFETKVLVDAVATTARQTIGRVVLEDISPYDSHKFPSTESVAESTQEMAIPVLPETTAVEVKTVRLSADPGLVPFGEDPRHYPRGGRKRFFLAKVLD